MSFKDKFRKIYFEISVVLGISFLVICILLVLQLHTLLIGNVEENSDEYEATAPSVVRNEVAERSDIIGYQLCRNSTEHQIELFELLIIAHDQFNETQWDRDLKAYAEIIARNFVADFFTLSNKSSRTDVGGLQFVYEDLVDQFSTFAIDTFYLYLNQHIERFGHDALPTVATTTILSSSFESYWIEIEVDEDEYEEEEPTEPPWPWLYNEEEQEPLKEEIRIIVIEIEWTFEHSNLFHLSAFQTSARIVLLENETGARIHSIGLIEEPSENGYDTYNGDENQW